MILTATPIEWFELDALEQRMLPGWQWFLEHGHSPEFVAAMIVGLTEFEPRAGIPMERCDGPHCLTYVDDTARDEHGQLWCSSACEDDASHAEEQRRYAAGWAA